MIDRVLAAIGALFGRRRAVEPAAMAHVAKQRADAAGRALRGPCWRPACALPPWPPRGGSIPGSWDVRPSSPKGSAQAQEWAQQEAEIKKARKAAKRAA